MTTEPDAGQSQAGEPQSGRPGSGQPDPAGVQSTAPESGVLQPSGLGPLVDIQVLAAVLRSDRDDVASYTRVLSGALRDAFPPGVVQVEYQRSLGDRLAGRPGKPVALLVRGQDVELELSEGAHGSVKAQLRKVVGGVVISRRDIGIDEWVRLLASELSKRAAESSAARQALGDLLGT
jgi:hypothetical protein